MSSDQFCFFFTNRGHEKALKSELKKFTDWHYSFSCPQLLTYKWLGKNQSFLQKLKSLQQERVVLAQFFGMVLGKASIENLESETIALLKSHELSFQHIVYFCPLDTEDTVIEKKSDAFSRLQALEAYSEGKNDYVITFVEYKLGQFFVLYHPWNSIIELYQQFSGTNITNLNKVRSTLPPEAPSRAYLKLNESLQVVLKQKNIKGRQAIEFGSSPGGASYALCQKGLRVFGVDNGKMDPLFTTDALCKKRFMHIQSSMQQLRFEQLSELNCHPEYIFSDVNLSADLVLKYLTRLWPYFKIKAQYLFFTLKFTKWSDMDEFWQNDWPAIFKMMKSFRPKKTSTFLLPSHHHECLVVLSFSDKGN